jgi:HEPN domain-containing protein
MDDDTLPWLRYAESDLASAEMLRRGGECLNALFHLQQSVEKTLKALYIKQNASLPPRLHDLHKLAEQCRLDLSREQKLLLDDLTLSYTGSRYPENWGQRQDDIAPEEVDQLTALTKEFLTWLKQRL